MCAINDADPVAFCYQKSRKARKDHHCSECGRAIQKGEPYTHSSFGADGSVGTNKACSHCEVAGKWLQKHCGGYCFGEISEELKEHYEDGYREDNLQRLLIGIRCGWKASQGDGFLPIPG